MEEQQKKVKARFYVFLFCIVAVAAYTLFFTQNALTQLDNDAATMNLAGLQRMYSQRISKVALFVGYYHEMGDEFNKRKKLDSLVIVAETWKNDFDSLSIIISKQSSEIFSRLQKLKIHHDSILIAADSIIKNPDQATIKKYIGIIAKHELPFLLEMMSINKTLQQEAEQKQLAVKNTVWILGVATLITLSLAFYFIFFRLLKQQHESNHKLLAMTNELATYNEELTASNEEVFNNMTRLHETKKELEESEANLKLQIKRMPIAHIIWNPDFTVRTWNPAAEKIFGYTHQEMIGNNPYGKIISNEVKPFINDVWQRLVEGDTSANSINHNTTKDGSVIICDWTNTPIRDDKGQVTEVLSMATDITERKHAENKLLQLSEELQVANEELTASEEELRSNLEELILLKNQLEESEQHYRMLSENITDTVMLVDLDNRFQYLSPSATRLYGYTIEELMGKQGIDLIHPDDLKFVGDQALAKRKKGEEVFNIQCRIIKKDRTIVWTEFSTNPVFKDEIIVGYQSLVRDITERKRTEELIRESEQTIRLMTENIPGLFWVRDVDGSILYASSSWKKLLGEQPAVGSHYSTLLKAIHPDYLGEIRKASQASAANGFNFEVLSIGVDGVERWFHLQAFAVKDNTGNIYRVAGFGQDITDRKKAEDALRESERILKRAQEIGKVGSWAVDINNPLLEWSDETYKMCGIPVGKQITFNDLLDIIHPDDKDWVNQAWEKAMKTGDYKVVYRILTPEGKIKWVDISGDIEFDANGNFVRALGIGQDITERKAYESQLQQAKERAEAANRSKTEFLANMSHEIRTPLNSILGFSEILLQSANDAQSKNYLNTILSSGRTLLSLINDLLDMAKIDAGKLELQVEAIDPRKTIQEIHHMFITQATKKKLDFSNEFSSDFPKQIVVDDVRLKQILINLVGNAIKFTEKGFVKIKAGFVQNYPADGTGCLTLSVEDSGIGIHEKDLEAIFESFNQGTEQSVKHYGGTGLGLTITKRLTDLMNGELTVKSRVREGSEFSITLHNIPYIVTEKKSIGNATEKLLFKKSKILVVDDVATNRELVEAYMSDHDVEIIMAQNGLEAIAIAEAHKPDIILMDLRMPLMDGREAAKIISQTDSLKHIPIVAFTASLTTNETIGAPFKGLLNKPVQRKPLFDELKKYLPYELIADTNVKKILASDSNQEEKKDLQKHLPELQSHFLERANELIKTIDVSEMELFLNDLAEYTLQNNLVALSSLLDQLRASYRQFDLDGVNTHLTEFIEMIIKHQKLNLV